MLLLLITERLSGDRPPIPPARHKTSNSSAKASRNRSPQGCPRAGNQRPRATLFSSAYMPRFGPGFSSMRTSPRFVGESKAQSAAPPLSRLRLTIQWTPRLFRACEGLTHSISTASQMMSTQCGTFVHNSRRRSFVEALNAGQHPDSPSEARSPNTHASRTRVSSPPTEPQLPDVKQHMPRDYQSKLVSKSLFVLLEPLVQSYAILIT